MITFLRLICCLKNCILCLDDGLGCPATLILAFSPLWFLTRFHLLSLFLIFALLFTRLIALVDLLLSDLELLILHLLLGGLDHLGHPWVALTTHVYEEGSLHRQFRQGGLCWSLKRDRRLDKWRESMGRRGCLRRDLIRKGKVFAATTAAFLEGLCIVRIQGILVVLNLLHYDDMLGLSDL